MFRKLLTIFSLIGLLLSVGLWGASCWGPLECATTFGKGIWAQVVANDGRSRLIIAYDTAPREELWAIEWQNYPSELRSPEKRNLHRARFEHLLNNARRSWKKHLGIRRPRGLLGFRSHKSASVVTNGSTAVRVVRYDFSLWPLFVIFAVLPAVVISKPYYHRRKRKKLGLCLKCGYDLRASKDRCPECGETIDAKK